LVNICGVRDDFQYHLVHNGTEGKEGKAMTCSMSGFFFGRERRGPECGWCKKNFFP
jgi:hypothetical protein